METDKILEKSKNELLEKNTYIINKTAFDDFLKNNLNNPQFTGKYVAFVHGKFQDVSSKENALLRKMCAKFGNVHMYIEQIIDSPRIVRLRTPEFI